MMAYAWLCGLSRRVGALQTSIIIITMPHTTMQIMWIALTASHSKSAIIYTGTAEQKFLPLF